MSSWKDALIFWFKLSIIVLILSSLRFCTDEKHARKVLEDNGYTNIEFTGYKYFACAKDDSLHTGFTATSSNNRKIEGTVCSSIFFKNATIRFE